MRYFNLTLAVICLQCKCSLRCKQKGEFKMPKAIELVHVGKKFKNRTILKDINLVINSGEIIGLLGPNGAGKSTLIKIMTGLIKQDYGEVYLLGRQLGQQRRNTNALLGLAPQQLALYPQLTVVQNLKNFGFINGLNQTEVNQKTSDLLATFALTSIKKQLAEDLSGGQKRRLHSAIALMNNAKIVFLDEPTVGADVTSRDKILNAVKRLSQQGITVIYTTHYLQEIEDLNAKIVFLNHGKIEAIGSKEKIIQQYAHPAIELWFQGKLPTIAGWKRKGNCLEYKTAPANFPVAMILKSALTDNEIQNYQLQEIKLSHSNLESAYRGLIKGGISHEA